MPQVREWQIKKIIKTAIFAIVFLSIFFLLISLLPIKNNIRFLVVSSGSMEPAVHAGSLILTTPRNDYQIGDIVAYHISSEDNKKFLVTHRIVEIVESKSGKAFITKGDVNAIVDNRPIKKELIIGKYSFQIPYLGYLINWGQSKYASVLIIAIGAIIIYRELVKIKIQIGIIKERKKPTTNRKIVENKNKSDKKTKNTKKKQYVKNN